MQEAGLKRRGELELGARKRGFEDMQRATGSGIPGNPGRNELKSFRVYLMQPGLSRVRTKRVAIMSNTTGVVEEKLILS